MDIVEFAEKYYGVTLFEWQKEYLRTLDGLYKQGDVRIVMIPRGVGRMFTYFKLKELIPDGKTSYSE
jgi:hypothetical protein